jgi:hypothetical protein
VIAHHSEQSGYILLSLRVVGTGSVDAPMSMHGCEGQIRNVEGPDLHNDNARVVVHTARVRTNMIIRFTIIDLGTRTNS